MDELVADSFGTLTPKAKAALEEAIAATCLPNESEWIYPHPLLTLNLVRR